MTFYTPIATGAAANAATFNAPLAQIDGVMVGLRGGDNGFLQLSFDIDAALDIASGAITIARTREFVDTQGGAPTDNLVTINGGVDGDLLFLQAVSAARVVTVKHNTGNIYLAGEGDLALDSQYKMLALVYDGNVNKWCEMGAGYWTRKLNLDTPGTLTLVADTVTVTKSRHAIDTQGGAATDNLQTMSGGNSGDVVIITSVSAARVITIKHNTGNIKTRAGNDIVLDDPYRTAVFVYDGTYWLEIASSSSFLMKDKLATSFSSVRSLVLPFGSFRALTGTNTYEALVTPSPEVRNQVRIKADGTTFLSGDAAITVTADATANDNANNGHYVQVTTTAGAGNSANLKTTNFNVVRRRWNPTFVAVLKSDGSINNRRIWAGMFGAVPGSVDTLTTPGIGFRYSTGAADANWKGVCFDGTTQTTVDTGVAIAGSTKFVLKVRVDTTNSICYFSVNDSTEVSISTNLPAETQNLGLVAELITLNAVARGLSISRLYCEYD